MPHCRNSFENATEIKSNIKITKHKIEKLKVIIKIIYFNVYWKFTACYKFDLKCWTQKNNWINLNEKKFVEILLQKKLIRFAKFDIDQFVSVSLIVVAL